MTAREKPRQLNISNVDEDIYDSFKDICQDKRMSAKELFTDMFHTWKAGEKNLTSRERLLIQEAVDMSQIDAETFKKIALLEKAHRVLRQKNRSLKMGEEYVGKSKGADLKAYGFLEKMFEHNDTATDKYEKIYINSRSLSKFADNSLNQDVVKRCLLSNDGKIETHHHQHGLHANHNRDCALRLKMLKKQEVQNRSPSESGTPLTQKVKKDKK